MAGEVAAHLIADLDEKRTLGLRTIESQCDLLELGLTALRDGRPHITEEYVERAVEALRQAAQGMRL